MTNINSFLFEGSSNDVRVKAKADNHVTFSTGAYTLSYSFGLASDTVADIESKQPLTTTITLVEECDIPILS